MKTKKVSKAGSSKKASANACPSAGDDGVAGQKTMELLEDGLEEPDAGGDTLKISQAYAKGYNERKNKHELVRANRILADEDGDDKNSDDSTTEPEDEDADLLTEKAESKIFDTLVKIKSKDPSIYDKSRVFFSDEDFKPSKEGTGSADAEKKKKKKKGTRYKDFLRETLMRDGAEAFMKEDEREEKLKKTPQDEQKELRMSLISAAYGEEEEDGDDFLGMRDKTAEEVKAEEEAFAEFNAKKNKERSKDTEDIAKRYWKADEDLGESERFLRDFILKKGWLETTGMQDESQLREQRRRKRNEDASGSDGSSTEVEKADEYEKDYNFRFEMENGGQIQGHKRIIESSVRQVKESRKKRQRETKKDRREVDNIRRAEELKRLKNLKKQEITRRLQQLQEVTGNVELPLDQFKLDVDFDPDKHDQQMSTVFNEQYDEEQEELDEGELLKAPKGLAELDTSMSAREVLKHQKWSVGASNEEGYEEDYEEGYEEGQDGDWDNTGDANGEEVQDEAAEEDEGGFVDSKEEEEVEKHGLWWMCDVCGLAIQGGKKRFDCLVCEDYTLCVKCFRCRTHPHKFAPRKVPLRAVPPEEMKEKEPVRDEGFDKLLDEYFQMDYEDIIGGDLPCRFKYTKVKPSGYGLSVAQILEKDDKELRQVMPIKLMRPYRPEKDAKAYRARNWKMKEEKKKRQAGGGEGTASSTGGVSAKRLEAYKVNDEPLKKKKKGRRMNWEAKKPGKKTREAKKKAKAAKEAE